MRLASLPLWVENAPPPTVPAVRPAALPKPDELLASTARRHGDRVRLELRHLEALLRVPGWRVLRLVLNDVQLDYARPRLSAVRRALAPFSDRSVAVDVSRSALRYVWRGGRGGLLYYPGPAPRKERDGDVVTVVLP